MPEKKTIMDYLEENIKQTVTLPLDENEGNHSVASA